jgi:hypothetical protein
MDSVVFDLCRCAEALWLWHGSAGGFVWLTREHVAHGHVAERSAPYMDRKKYQSKK